MDLEVGVEGNGFPGAIRPVTHTQKEEGRAVARKCTGGGRGGVPSTGSQGYIINLRKNSNLGTPT